MARNKNERIYSREQQIPHSSQDPTLWANSFFFYSGFFLKLCNSRYFADTFISQFISFRQLTVDATIGKRESLNYELLSLLCLITTLFLLFATLYVSSNVF